MVVYVCNFTICCYYYVFLGQFANLQGKSGVDIVDEHNNSQNEKRVIRVKQTEEVEYRDLSFGS